MTNKPMLSVERDLLENIALGLEKKGFGINWAVELRALLDAPVIDLLDKCGVQMVDCPECTHQWDHFFNCGNKPAAECEHSFHYFGDYPRRRCNNCNALEVVAEGKGREQS